MKAAVRNGAGLGGQSRSNTNCIDKANQVWQKAKKRKHMSACFTAA